MQPNAKDGRFEVYVPPAHECDPPNNDIGDGSVWVCSCGHTWTYARGLWRESFSKADIAIFTAAMIAMLLLLLAALL